ncbi:MAG: ABC transporter ATP-binding protein [Deltaproteobacteria bacterium]|nr:ABC transporter ATP-binding protein [Deltaproteobacteria bacterium]
MLLEIKNLRIQYGKAEALKGISLDIEDGSIVTLIGANGAGKTTTLRAVSGSKRPSSGDIFFKGERINDKKAHEIVKLGIGHIPEGRMVFAPMTVWDNLLLGAHLRKDKQGIARDLDNIYGHFPVLKTKLRQRAGSLSGGEQQMLATARALMARPRLLLMDEPSMGLAPLLVAQVGKIIEDINRQGVSILLVEQNARMALNLAAKAYVLQVGRIVLEGEAKVLADNEEIKKAYLGIGD